MHAVLLCIVTQKHRRNGMYTVLEETAPKPLENPYHQVTLLGEGFPYYEWHDINDLYISSILSETNHFNRIYKLQAGALMHTALGAYVHRLLMLATLTEVVVVY